MSISEVVPTTIIACPRLLEESLTISRHVDSTLVVTGSGIASNEILSKGRPHHIAHIHLRWYPHPVRSFCPKHRDDVR